VPDFVSVVRDECEYTGAVATARTMLALGKHNTAAVTEC
jgi:hypothetical protein